MSSSLPPTNRLYSHDHGRLCSASWSVPYTQDRKSSPFQYSWNTAHDLYHYKPYRKRPRPIPPGARASRELSDQRLVATRNPTRAGAASVRQSYDQYMAPRRSPDCASPSVSPALPPIPHYCSTKPGPYRYPDHAPRASSHYSTDL